MRIRIVPSDVDLIKFTLFEAYQRKDSSIMFCTKRASS